MPELNLYTIDEIYSKYMYSIEPRTMKAFEKKNKRPFVGIVLKIENINYFAPLSSPKEKHSKMKTSLDFIKINNGRDGIINLNNMIPVPLGNCIIIDIKEQIKKDKKYGLILKYQSTWCNENKEQIIKKAQKLYELIIKNKANSKLKERCCDFKQLEDKYNQFKPKK